MKYLVQKSKDILRVEQETNANITDTLHTLYVIRDLDKREISVLLNVNRNSVAKWLDMCGIYSKRLRIK